MGWSFEYFSGSVKQYAEYLIETEIDLKNKKNSRLSCFWKRSCCKNFI